MEASRDELIERFAHHPPVNDLVIETHQDIRTAFTDIALFLRGVLPPSREASLCQTALQEAAMWANAAIAIHMNKAEVDSATQD